MSKEYIVVIKPLSDVELSSYGIAVACDEKKRPDNSGEGWKCWYPIGELHANDLLSIGIVRSEPRPLLLYSMERHQDRSEWVYAIDKPMIQTVALSSSKYPDQPDPEKTKAVLLHPGQGIIVAPGVWHSVGLPHANEAVIYGFVLGAASIEEKKHDKGWVTFANQIVVKLVFIKP